MTAIRTRLEALESAVRPTASVLLDLDALPADDRAFIDEIGAKYELDDERLNYAQMSVHELRRLCDIAEQYARPAP